MALGSLRHQTCSSDLTPGFRVDGITALREQKEKPLFTYAKNRKKSY